MKVDPLARVRPDLVWASLLAAGVAYETYALNNGREGYTLSENVRSWFHVESPAGKLAFASGWLALSAWFVPHIISKAAEAAAEVMAERS
jgi:hypothetical protein